MREEPEITNLGELKIWIGGRFDLASQDRGHTNEELSKLRERVHDLSNEVAKLNALNFTETAQVVKRHAEELERIDLQAAERKGAIRALKAAYAIGGAVVGATATIVLELAKIILK